MGSFDAEYDPTEVYSDSNASDSEDQDHDIINETPPMNIILTLSRPLDAALPTPLPIIKTEVESETSTHRLELLPSQAMELQESDFRKVCGPCVGSK